MSQSAYPLNREKADLDQLQRILNEIALRLVNLEQIRTDLNQATAELNAFALARIDETLRSAIELVGNISAFGLLTFNFEGEEFELELGENTLNVPDGKRAAFSPTPLLDFGRLDDAFVGKFATAELVSYDNETGVLVVNVIALHEDLIGEAFDDWWIACSAGVAPTVAALVEQAQTAASTATTKAAEAAASAIAAALFDPSNYYVKSVIDAALAGKSATGHTHLMSNVSGLESALSAKADADSDIAKIDEARTWSASQRMGRITGNVGAVPALDIDCSAQTNVFTKTVAGDSTFTVSNVPATGQSYAFSLLLTYTSGTITWFSGVNWNGGVAPILTTGKKYLLVFHTIDGGTVWRVSGGEYAA